MLQATNDIVNGTPAPIKCRDGEYVDSHELCSGNETDQGEPASCSGGSCENNSSDNAGKCKLVACILSAACSYNLWLSAS